jgi:uncharacterized membrane protein
MSICGGICFILIYSINERAIHWGILKKCLAGAIVITAVELFSGCLVNIYMGWRVWDYSNMPFQILGQICLQFSALWFLLCIPSMLLADIMNKKLFGHKKN